MKKVIVLVLLLMCIPVYAWEGYDYEANSAVSIGKGNLVRRGSEIEVFDYGAGEYKNYEVEYINRVGNIVKVEVYDYENDTYRTLEMHD